MKKSVHSGIYMLFLNFLFWLGNYYPRHIIESFSLGTVTLIIANLLFSVLYGYVLIIAFSDSNSFKDGFFTSHYKLCFKDILKKLIAFVVLQFVVDFVLFYIKSSNVKALYIVGTLLILIQWLISYILLTENRKSIFKNRILFCVSVFLVLAVTVVSLIHDFTSMTELSSISSKYYSDSSMFIAGKRAIDFEYLFKLFLFDSAVGIIFIIFHFLNNKKVSSKNTDELVRMSIFREFVRICFVLSLFFILFVFKTVIAPLGTLLGYHSTNSNSSGIDHLDTSGRSITVYKIGVDREETVWFYKIDHTLKLDNDTFFELTMYDRYDYIIKDDKVISGNIYNEVHYKDNTYLFKSQAIVYEEDGIYKAVALDELKSYERNDTVIEVCKKMFAEGSIYAFEYVCDYLYEYDRDFILPYIERYGRGEFTPIETEWMDLCSYKKEFVIDTAKRFSLN